MKKILTILGIIVSLLILDVSIMPFFSIKGCYPSLVLVFSIFLSLLNERKEAIFIGVISGLFQDLYFVGIIGVNSISNLIVCLLACEIGRTIFKEKYFIPILSCFLLSFIKGLIIIIISLFIKQYVAFNSVLFISLYNFIIGVFMYRMVYKLNEKSWMKNYWKY